MRTYRVVTMYSHVLEKYSLTLLNFYFNFDFGVVLLTGEIISERRLRNPVTKYVVNTLTALYRSFLYFTNFFTQSRQTTQTFPRHIRSRLSETLSGYTSFFRTLISSTFYQTTLVSVTLGIQLLLIHLSQIHLPN